MKTWGEILAELDEWEKRERAKATQYGDEGDDEDDEKRPVPKVCEEVTEFLPGKFAPQPEVVEEVRGEGGIEIGCPDGTGTVGVEYDSEFTVTGGTEPFFFEITSGDLPDGLSLDPDTGTISGTPTIDGEFDFTVTVTDDEGNTGEADCSITIIGSPPDCICADYFLFWAYYDTGRPPGYWHYCYRVQAFNFNLMTEEVGAVRTLRLPAGFIPEDHILIEESDVPMRCFSETMLENPGVEEIFGFWFTPNGAAVSALLNDMTFDTALPALPDATERVIGVTIYEEFHRPWAYQESAPHRDFSAYSETDSLPKVLYVCYSNATF